MGDPVDDAFAATPRGAFLPEALRARASYDGPLEIGHGQTNSQPRTVDAMLRLLDVRRGDRVLDVGAGSGWTTALLAHLTGSEGVVHGVELEPDLAATGAENLAAMHRPWASLQHADPDRLGLPGHAPFDRILVSAEPAALPAALVEQLTADGILVIPVAGVMLRVERRGDQVAVTEHGRYRFVPLR